MKLAWYSFSAVALALPVSAQAQSTAVEDIVVTARRVDENLQDVPVAVTALSGATIEQKSIRDLRDLGQSVPNLSAQVHSINPTSVALTIRGQAQPDLVLTVDPTVGLYVDGVNYPRSLGMRSNVIDVERVEVLRGPQGTLYGKNTTGGAFSVITRSPGDDLGASVAMRAGNYGMIGGTAVLNLPVGEGVGVRLVGDLNNRTEGFAEDRFGRELASERSRFVRGKLKLEPVDNLTLLFAADYQKYRGGGVIAQLGGPVTLGGAAAQYAAENGLSVVDAAAAMTAEGFGLPRNRSSGTYTTGTDFKAHGYSLDANWALSDAFALRSISSWRKFTSTNQQDLDATAATVLNSGNVSIPTWDRNLTQEVQLLYNSDALNAVAGVYYGSERGVEGAESFVLPALLGRKNLNDATALSKSLGVFAQASWRFTPTWSLTAGFRFTRERKGMINRNRGVDLTTGAVTCNVPTELLDQPGQCVGTFSKIFKKPSWLISLQHDVSDDLMAYVKASRSFRSGGQNIRGSNIVASFDPFRPEVATEYEFGFKSELLDRSLRLNGAIFYDDMQDVQRSVLVLAPSGSTVTVMTNAAAARLYGGELEATWKVSSQLQLAGSVGYTNAKYKTFVDFTGDRSMEDWPAPKWQANMSARYTIDTAIGELSVQADVYHQSKLNLATSSKRRNEVMQSGYVMLNGRVALATLGHEDLEIAAFVRNVTDKKIYATAVNLESLGYNLLFLGDRRTFGIELKARFGGEAR